jgi:hypothetical protein
VDTEASVKRPALMRAVVKAAAAAGVPLKAGTIEQPTLRPALMVLEVPQEMAPELSTQMATAFKQALDGTPFEDVKTIVLSGGIRLTCIGEDGTVLNQPLDNTAVEPQAKRRATRAK